MDRSIRQAAARYGFAVASVALVFPLKFVVLDDLVGEASPYLLFFFPVILTAWRAGAGPGLLAVALNTLACVYEHDPLSSPRIEDGREALMLTIFVGEGLLVCWLMEQLRRARSRAEEARRAQELFLAMVSHELRVPLNPVLMEASARLDDPSTPASLRPAFERIRAGVGLQARLIDDLLDAVRLGRGELSFRFEPVDVSEVVALALEACRPEWEAKGQRVAVELSASPSKVRGDGARLQQVVWNLVRNAVKFTPEGGRIAVRSREEPGGLLAVEVSDSGVGIDPEDLERIFGPFAQGTATLGRFAGLGLGLAICRSIVEAHGGSLEASSPGRGRGARFTLRLPALPIPDARPGLPAGAEAGARVDPGAEAVVPGQAPRHLLLVEDDEPTALVMAELLRQDGYEVTVARSVAEALAAPIGRIDCVISDLELPDGNGEELLERLRDRREIPAIALTGYRDRPGDPRRAVPPDGFAARLVKPVDYPTLEAAIREALALLPC